MAEENEKKPEFVVHKKQPENASVAASGNSPEKKKYFRQKKISQMFFFLHVKVLHFRIWKNIF